MIPKYSAPYDNAGTNHEIGGLSPERRKKFDASITRMNADIYWLRMNGGAIPQIYRDHAKTIVEHSIHSASVSPDQKKNTMVSVSEDLYVLDREKARTYYQSNYAGQVFEPITRVLGSFKWDIKQYLIQKLGDKVKFTRNFKSPKYISVQTSEQQDVGVGWYVGYQFDRFDLAANQGEFFDLQYEVMMEAMSQMGRLAHEHLLTGTTVEHGGADDSGSTSILDKKGFLNHGSAQTFTTSTLNTYNNLYKALLEALADLKKCYATTNRVLISSAGIHSQALANYNTYTDMSEFTKMTRDLIGPGKPISAWHVMDQVTGAAISTSTQAWYLLALDPRLLSRLIILPLQTLPTMDKTFVDDISEVVLAGDILRFSPYDTTENVFPVSGSASLTTADVGIVDCQRVA
jgi:hypothetical protein